jgi:hypothetical protein
MCTTLIALISSGESRPNWISLIVRRGHFDCNGAPGGMIADVVGLRAREGRCGPFYRAPG